jgi:predicted nuclease of predicted toxin-antitoxin system
MKLLLDSCISGKAAEELRAAGHDVVWTGDWPQDPGDEEILARAHSERRILITLDKDFGELAIVRGLPHSGMLRIANFSARAQASVVQQVLDQHGSELQGGAVVTAEPGRVRIRPPDSAGEETPTTPLRQGLGQ